MLLGCAAATCRGVRLSCSYTEKLPRNKQPQVQELPGWEYNHCSFRMATLSFSGTQRFMGVRVCTHIQVWTHSPVPGILQAKQICQRDGKRKYNPQEFNSKRNSKRKRGLKAAHSSLLICLSIPHTAPALLSCIPVHWKSPVLSRFIKKLFCKAPMLLTKKFLPLKKPVNPKATQGSFRSQKKILAEHNNDKFGAVEIRWMFI